MTTVTMKRDGDSYEVTCKDHAGDKRVCAAVSTLCYTLVGYLRDYECCRKLDYDLTEGDAHIVFEGEALCCQVAFHMAGTGFSMLEYSYPANVKLFHEEK